MSRPAFISVGEFGRKSSAVISSRKRASQRGCARCVVRRIDQFCLRDVVCDAGEELLRRLERYAGIVAREVAALEYEAGVLGELDASWDLILELA